MRGTIRNRIAKYYLRQWPYFDKNLEYLSLSQEVKAKILYSALKELDPVERVYLANKYRVTVKPFIKDSVLAEKHGMTLKEYRQKRIEIETKFQSIIDTKIPIYQSELKKAFDIEFGRIKA